MPAKTDPRTERGGNSESEHERRARAVADTRARFTYRRELEIRDIGAALAIAITAGLVAFYIAGVLLQRTPLQERSRSSRRGRKALRARGG